MKLTLLTAELRRIHSLAQDLHRHGAGLLQSLVLLVVLLEETLRAGIVRTDTCCLPSAVISTRVALVQLELTKVVPSSIDE